MSTRESLHICSGKIVIILLLQALRCKYNQDFISLIPCHLLPTFSLLPLVSLLLCFPFLCFLSCLDFPVFSSFFPHFSTVLSLQKLIGQSEVFPSNQKQGLLSDHVARDLSEIMREEALGKLPPNTGDS